VFGLAAVGALVGLVASGEPTTLPVVDAALRMAFGFGVTVVASEARRWSLVLLAAGAAALAGASFAAVVGWAALALAVGLVVFDHRRRWLAALVGLLSVTALLHLPATTSQLVTTMVAGACLVPMAVSVFRIQNRDVRRQAGRGLVGAGAAVGVIVAGFAVALVVGGGQADRGLDEVRAGLAAARTGDDEATDAHFRAASDEFAAAEATFTAWYAQPSRLLPVVGYHTDALAQASASGAELSATAREVSGTANYRSVDMVDGRIDLDWIRGLAAPLAEVRGALDDARVDTDAIETRWLAPPVADRVDGLRAEIASATEEAATAAEAVEVAPGLLGGDGPRRYFVAFLNPAESRGLGGFMGNWAELTAVDGKLSLARSGRSAELAHRPRDPVRALGAPDDYVARYGVFHPEDDLRDISLSPDFPSVAAALDSVYPQTAVGAPIDGVLALDPYALAAMLEFTGPVQVDGIDAPLAAENAVDYLLREQYLAFDPATENEERIDVLDDAGTATFDAFLRTRALRPGRLARVFGPVVEQGRLLVTTNDPAEAAFLERIGLAGSFPVADVADLFSVVTQNAGNNKIDVFLHRSTTYEATFDPTTGAVEARVTVRLRNDAPSTGLSSYVIRNRPDSGQPDGVNWLWFNVYSPHLLASASLDGQPLAMGAQGELGVNVYHAYLPVPSEGEATVVLDLMGAIAPSSTYRVAWYAQPMVNPDELAVTVTPQSPWHGPGAASGEPIEVAVDPVAGRAEVALSAG